MRSLILLSMFVSMVSFASPVEKYQWNLSAIYADEGAWKADMEKVRSRFPEIRKCQGHLGDSAESLKKCLDLYFDLRKTDARIATWAELKKAGDVSNSKNIEAMGMAEDLGAKFGQESAFISPEIAALGREKVEKFESKLPALSIYKQFLRVILDQTDHLLDTPREELVASLSPVTDTSVDIQRILLSSDIAWKQVKLSDGKMHVANQTTYEKYRESAIREDRLKVFSAFYSVLSQFQNTLGDSLGLATKRDVIMARTRKYPNALSASLDSDKIPEEVYRMLIQQVNAGLPVYHSYLSLQKKRLGISKMEYADAYAPAGKFDVKFPIEKSKAVVLEALAPLGSEYQKKLASAFEGGWMDVYPKQGKQNGAFMNPAAYDVHPYLLLNHLDNFSSASTLAHEWGHAMHSVYSQANQSYVNSDYATFIAEIASTTNEVLLHEYLIKNAKSKQEKAFYLESLLKLIRTTFFRQSQFAEFQLRIHEELEKGSALSGHRMSEIYGDIARRYYGHDKGVMTIDPKYFSEWAFVPHFYEGFYVYQYATSISAGFYFAENILNGIPGAQEKYLDVLKSGGSKYPYEILLDAGVDMKAPQVYQSIVARMKKAVEELGAL